MNNRFASTLVVFLAGAVVGVAIEHLPAAIAASQASSPHLDKRTFRVFIDEVKRNFVFGDEFVGHYSKVLTMSDGSRRVIELTPMVHNGMEVVELKDGGGHSYMGLNGTTTNGTLMVQIRDEALTRRELKEWGWKIP